MSHRKPEGSLQRSAVNAAPLKRFPPSARNRLGSPGQAIATPEGARFGQDFSHVPTYAPGPGVIQAKLAINAPGDRFEQEADTIADRVITAPLEQISRGTPARIQRFTSQPATGFATAPASVDRALASSGSPLQPALRQEMEQRFGYGFSQVRVHTGTAAGRSARDVNAHAYTVGSDIVFAANRFAPGTRQGRHLIAHELAHVVQQSGADALHLDQARENRSRPAVVSRHLQRAPDDSTDCGSTVADKDLRCDGISRDGPGAVLEIPGGWELSNFDVDKHFLKPEHLKELKKIVPILKAYIKANPGKSGVVTLVGEASTTAGTCYNLRLSRRRARCVARELEALGIPADALNVGWIGDLASEMRLGEKPAPTRRDIENPDDRRVSIYLKKVKKKDAECSPKDKLRSTKSLDFRFGCLSRDKFSVVIADLSQSPAIYREFTWQKLIAFPSQCEFFPDLDPSETQSYAFTKPVRLAWTEDPDSPSDFSSVVLQTSRLLGTDPDPYDLLNFESNGEETQVDFPGTWSPASCEAGLKPGSTLATIGKLTPAGPVECGPMPVPKSVKCEKPKEEECSKDRRESAASHFKVKTEKLSLKEKAVHWLGDKVVGHEIRNFNIGTVKSNEEKKKSGEDIWRPYVFAGKLVYGPGDCEQRDPLDSARGKGKLDKKEKLDGLNFRPATLTRPANSNVEYLSILGFGTIKLLGEKCAPGKTEILAGAITEAGNVRCEPLEMESPPGEQSCKDECPEARRTCPDTKFRFRFGRMAPESAPPQLQKQLLQFGCQAEFARVNIGSISTKPIWRPFYWVQATRPCPFTVRSEDLLGTAGKVSVGVKPELKFKWPPIGVKKEIQTEGLRLATENPDDPAAASDFSLATELGTWLTASGTSSDIGITGVKFSYSKMAVFGSPVDWTGTCKSSDQGALIPAGKVQCGWAPPAPHQAAPAETCPTGLTTAVENVAILGHSFNLLAPLGNHPGIITQVTRGSVPLYSAGMFYKDVHFVGQTFDVGTKLAPVVTRFDMLVQSVVQYSGRIYLTFIILSEPCTYRWGTQRVPLRFSSSSCEDSLKKGQVYTISNTLPVLPAPSKPKGP